MTILHGRLEDVIDSSIKNGEHLAVVLIDMQETPFGRRLQKGCYPVLNQKIRRQTEVLGFAVIKQIPIYLIEFPRKTEGPTLFCLRHVAKGAEEADYTITKKYCSAFEDTALERRLDEQNISSLLLMGWHTDVCVLSTARDAYPKYHILTSPSVLLGNVWNQGNAADPTELNDFYYEKCRVYDDKELEKKLLVEKP